MAGLQFDSGINDGFEKDLRRMNKQLNDFDRKAIKSTKEVNSGFKDISNTIKNMVAFGGIAASGNEIVKLTNDVFKLRVEVGKLTDLQGAELNTFTADLQASADTFGLNVSQLGLAVSNYAKGMQISFTDALKQVDKDLIDGAGSMDAYLSTIEEYPGLMREAGLTTKDLSAAIKMQTDLGVKDDYGIDAIKEASTRLREMPKATSDALTKVDIDVQEMQAKIADGSMSFFDATQQVSTKLKEMGANGKYTGEIIANVFGGPGENSGYEYLITLADIGEASKDVNKQLTETQKQETELLKVNKELQQAISNVMPEGNPLLELQITAKELVIWLLENKKIIIGLGAAIAAWKASTVALSAVEKLRAGQSIPNLTKEIELSRQKVAAELRSLSVEKESLQVSLSKTASLAKVEKDRIVALSQKIQTEKAALSTAIQSKNLTAARAAQVKLAALEDKKAAAITAHKTLTTNAQTIANNINANSTKAAATQTKLNSIADKQAAVSKNILTASIFRLTTAFKSLKLAFATNPFGLIVTGISFALPWLLDLIGATDDAAEAQGGLNEQIEKTKKLQEGFADVTKKQAVLQTLSTQSVKEHKSAIEAELRANQVANETIVADLNKRLETDKTYNKYLADSKKESLKAQKAFNLRQAQIREEELKAEFRDRFDANKERLKVLKAGLVETEKLLKERGGKDEEGKPSGSIIDPKTEKDAAEKAAKAAKEAQEKALLELTKKHQESKNEILKQHEFEKSANVEKNQKLLENDLQYLREKRKITLDELERLKIDEQIITTQAATASTVKLDFIGRNKAESGISNEAINKQVELLQKRVDVAKKYSNENAKTNLTVKDQAALFADVADAAAQVQSQFGDTNSELGIIVNSTAQAAQGFMGMVDGIQAAGDAVTALEKASVILGIISAVLKLSDAINGAFSAMSEKRQAEQVAEMQNVHFINLELIEQNRLYAEGNELLSSDAWGTALKGLESYNQALELQNDLISDLAGNATEQSSTVLQDLSKTILDPTKGPLSLLGGRNERKQLENIRKQAKNYATELEQALAGVAVKTDEKSRIGGFFGQADQYKSLLQIYPQLVDEAGDLNTELLQTAIESQDIAATDKERLTQLIELTEAAETSYQQFGEYISGIFGSVADDVSQAFQTMYETGDDAMTALEGSMSDMIETFTRDIVEFSLLQPLTSQVNEAAKTLGAEYAQGDISAEQLQEGIITNLGDFYDSLNAIQPQILEAYENADKLAEEAGFGAAFDGSDGGVATASTTSAAQIKQAITEQTGSELVGRVNAILLTSQTLSQNSFEMVDLAVANLAALNKIVTNTDYLPEIAANTKKTYEKLSNI